MNAVVAEADSQSAFSLHTNSRLGQVLAVVLATLIYLASEAPHHAFPTAWLAAMFVIAAWRFITSSLYLRAAEAERRQVRWRYQAIAGAGVAGVGWALGAYLFMWQAPVHQQFS